MSGTSLDGLDIACCAFRYTGTKWVFTIEASETIRYSTAWTKKLQAAHTLSVEGLLALHSSYGKWLGEAVVAFRTKHALKGVHFIASHGHTVFHQPANGFTFQLGDGHALYAVSKLPVISDFRSLDVALGGEGAPLVPIGDKLLFSEYDVCLNLGGIANLSIDKNGQRIAYDVCYANMGLNYLTQKIKKAYDHDGALAERGELNTKLLTQLSKKYEVLRASRPSLGREGFEKIVQPLLDNNAISLHDRLNTFTESIALEITKAIGDQKFQRVLCTGGGAFNRFLLYRLVEHGGDVNTLVLPDETIINFKEALVFAFLGVLRVRGEINTLKSVTKASKNSSSGVMIGF